MKPAETLHDFSKVGIVSKEDFLRWTWEWWWKNLEAAVGTKKHAFDCVRLPPHSAQGDREMEMTVGERASLQVARLPSIISPALSFVNDVSLPGGTAWQVLSPRSMLIYSRSAPSPYSEH
jgi:hypothetical protein